MTPSVGLRGPDWPLEMLAETAAAFFDFPTRRAFLDAVRRGEYPRPSATRGSKQQPIWYRPHCLDFLERRHASAVTAPRLDDAAELI